MGTRLGGAHRPVRSSGTTMECAGTSVSDDGAIRRLSDELARQPGGQWMIRLVGVLLVMAIVATLATH